MASNRARNWNITIKLDAQTYKELKATTLALKNVNIFGTKCKSVSDDEIGSLIILALKQKEFIETLRELKDKAQNGFK